MRLPNGFGNVSKLPGNRRRPWRARKTISLITDDVTGRTKQAYKTIGYYESQDAALIALSEYNKCPYDIDARTITFAGLYEQWSEVKYRNISPSSARIYMSAYKACEPICDVPFADLRKSHLQSVIDNCGKNFPTLQRIKLLYGQLYKYAMENDICDKDYSKFVDVAQYAAQNDNKRPHVAFTRNEIAELWNQHENTHVKTILVLIYTGLRIGELLNLKTEDVHLQERFFNVVAAKTRAGVRTVPIAEKIAWIFQEWLETTTSKYLLPGIEKDKLAYSSYLTRHWEPIMSWLGLIHRPHDTRHTCVSLLTSAGVSDKVIKKIVGHAGKDVTEAVYTHFELSEILDAINKI